VEKYNKYEYARLIGARALQISMGAPLKVKLTKKKLEELEYNAIKIAQLELSEGVLPIDVVRD